MTLLILDTDSVRIAQPQLVEKFGTKRAIFLQQLHYLLNKNDSFGTLHDGRKWIYNTYEDWVDELKDTSVASINRYIRYFKDLGVLLSESLSAFKSNRTKYYTINYERLNEILGNTAPKTFVDHTSKMIKSSDHTDLMVIQRLPTKINTILSEGEPSKEKGNSCEDFKNNLQEKIVVKQEVTTSKTPSNQESQPFQPLTKDAQTFEKASTILNQLIDIYNQEVGYFVGKSTLTKDRARFLMAVYIKKFNKNLEKWTSFCKSLASSDYLMGKVNKAFKLSFDWLLKFQTIDRILNGELGITKTVSSFEEETTVHEKATEVQETISTSDNEPELRQVLVNEVGALSYEKTFKNCTFDREEILCPITGEIEETLVIETPSAEVKADITYFYKDKVLNTFRVRGVAKTIAFRPVMSATQKIQKNQENKHLFEQFQSFLNSHTVDEQQAIIGAKGYSYKPSDLFGKITLFEAFKETLQEQKMAA